MLLWERERATGVWHGDDGGWRETICMCKCVWKVSSAHVCRVAQRLDAVSCDVSYAHVVFTCLRAHAALENSLVATTRAQNHVMLVSVPHVHASPSPLNPVHVVNPSLHLPLPALHVSLLSPHAHPAATVCCHVVCITAHNPVMTAHVVPVHPSCVAHVDVRHQSSTYHVWR